MNSNHNRGLARLHVAGCTGAFFLQAGNFLLHFCRPGRLNASDGRRVPARSKLRVQLCHPRLVPPAHDMRVPSLPALLAALMQDFKNHQNLHGDPFIFLKPAAGIGIIFPDARQLAVRC